MAKNEMQWSSATPGLLVILVDQSGSMTLPYDGGDSRTVFAAKAVNRLINTLIQKNFNGRTPKNRCYVAVIGYDVEAKVLAKGYLDKLNDNPIRIDTVQKKVSDGAGGLVEISSKMPVWVEPIKDNLWTNMTAAFLMAKDLVEAWISDKPQNPAPVIINISDGTPYYDQKDVNVCMKETISVVDQIKQLSTEDGSVQIFNAMIGEGQKVVFPSSESELITEEAKFLYEISTVIPEAYKRAAEKNQLVYQQGARGAICQADAELLIKLIDFGSSKGQGDR
ncbi:MAG: VWA domain-containing protein [Prevotella sp.]|nr:VWA domain-containing protein [Prevotella sp.]